MPRQLRDVSICVYHAGSGLRSDCAIREIFPREFEKGDGIPQWREDRPGGIFSDQVYVQGCFLLVDWDDGDGPLRRRGDESYDDDDGGLGGRIIVESTEIVLPSRTLDPIISIRIHHRSRHSFLPPGRPRWNPEMDANSTYIHKHTTPRLQTTNLHLLPTNPSAFPNPLPLPPLASPVLQHDPRNQPHFIAKPRPPRPRRSFAIIQTP